MRARSRHPTDAEIAVLRQLWQDGPVTARDITGRLYPSAKASDIATVQKLLQRLERKGYVHRERKPPAHVFEAKVSQQELAGEQLEEMARKLSDGSLTPFITHLASNQSLAESDRRQILEMIQKSP